MSLLRKLNSQGVEALKQYLSDISTEPDKPVPTVLLIDPSASEGLSLQLEIQMKQFSSRMEVAEYLFGVLSKSEAASPDRDPGVWAWLALLYFDQLCPKGNDGKRKVRELARYIPSGHAWRYYRHLLAGPYLIYKAHRDNPAKARIVLYGTLDTITDFLGGHPKAAM